MTTWRTPDVKVRKPDETVRMPDEAAAFRMCTPAELVPRRAQRPVEANGMPTQSLHRPKIW